jgi:hypothetical protein
MAIGYITDINAEFARLETEVSKNLKTIDGYTPKNNKCFCYPFNYLTLNNNSGVKVILKYELFNNPQSATATIKYYPVVGNNPVLLCVPVNYKGQAKNFDNSVQFANFPPLPWSYDVFKNWAALNSNSIAMSFAQKGLSVASAAVTGNLGGVIGGVTSTAAELANMADKAQQPDEVRGTPQGNALLYSGGAGVFARCECCKSEYISKVDDYFTRYGYLINEVKKPLLHNRKNFDYIQTRDIDITGAIPSDDLEELCNIFNNGVTIWHNPNTFGDYGVDNSPINS